MIQPLHAAPLAPIAEAWSPEPPTAELDRWTRVVGGVRDVRKTFAQGKETVPVLNGITLEVGRSEIVALEGPSGSGKTTLLSIMGCILTPTSGGVIVDGRAVDVGNLDGLARVRRRFIGFVFQQFNLFASLTVRQNVELALQVRGWRGREAQQEADRVLEAVGLSDRTGFLPRDLSGGQKQRVAVARAMAGRPPLLLADEPTANLDSHVGEQVLRMFRDLAKKDESGLLVVTHDPSVRRIADRVVQIRDGRLVA